MRQISIKKLKNTLCKELLDLPVEVTKYGQVVATIYKGSHKLNEEEKKKVATKKATIPTWVNPLSGSALAPKK